VIVYLHGFNSSAQSTKARVLGDWLAARGLAAHYACPSMPMRASEAIAMVEALMRAHPEAPFCFVGSSLGGFYATWLAERHGARAVLLNPAIEPQVGLRAWLGPQRNLYTGEPYTLTEAHLEDWRAHVAPRITPERYLLIVETGDELLDYRQALARYAGAASIVVEGGDHALQSFADHLPRILEFAGPQR